MSDTVAVVTAAGSDRLIGPGQDRRRIGDDMPFAYTQELDGTFTPITDVRTAIDALEINRQKSRARRAEREATRVSAAIERARALESWLHTDGFILEPEYHSSDDTVANNISVERLTVAMEIQGAAAYALAKD